MINYHGHSWTICVARVAMSFWGLRDSVDSVVQVLRLRSADHAFAAIKADGSVVTWGDRRHGGDSSQADWRIWMEDHLIRDTWIAGKSLELGNGDSNDMQ